MQLIHHGFDILRTILRANQRGALGLNHHQVAHPDEGRQTVAGHHHVIMRCHRFAQAQNRISGPVWLKMLAQCRPAADITPGEATTGHDDIVGLLHDGIVHGDLVELTVLLCQVLVTGVGPHDRLQPVRHGQKMGLEFTKSALQGRHRPYEHPRVPEKIARRDIALGRGRIGLFNEPPGGSQRHRTLGLYHVTAIDVTEAGAGEGRRDANRHQHIMRQGVIKALPDRGMEDVEVANHMVGRQDTERAIRATRFHQRRAQCHGRRRIATERLTHHVFRGQLGQRAARDLNQRGAGDDQHALGRNQLTDVIHGHRQHRLLRHKRQDLLGGLRITKRPEPLALAPRHDHRIGFF